ncbi:MAG: hypothetical protein K0Q66_617 [Chitinophagaceae bacterium]|jgi:hypothetical protein|nr:hypothetical protein [Chitinophagaceae bacterium]
MQQNYLYRRLRSLVFICLFVAGCKGGRKEPNLPTPDEYDLNRPEVIKLSDRLNEISGIVYYPKDSSLFSIIDEFGVLYKLVRKEKKNKMEVQQWRFSKASDYEDLVLVDSVFYAMKSKGDIVAFRFLTPDSLSSEEFDLPSEQKNEFESMYIDSGSNKLVLICKDCESDDKTKVTTWSFDLAQRAFSPGPYTLDPAEILSRQKPNEKRFKPSAARVHPITGDLYIISSINKVLVIADRKGVVKRVFQLDPDLYKQPEGLDFTPGGDMYISNEAGDEGLPNIMFFKYKKESR